MGGILELWKVGGGDNFEQVGVGGPQQWLCFHHWMMRPNV